MKNLIFGKIKGLVANFSLAHRASKEPSLGSIEYFSLEFVCWAGSISRPEDEDTKSNMDTFWVHHVNDFTSTGLFPHLFQNKFDLQQNLRQ